MKTVLVLFIIAVATLSCLAADHASLYHITFAHPPRLRTDDYTLYLSGVGYKDIEPLKAAVAKLPSGSRLVWSSGCFGFSEIPLGPTPRTTIPEFKSFCRQHHIQFDYFCGYNETLTTKSFVVPQLPLSSRSHTSESIDARKWFEDQGVTFPEGAFARWNPAKQLVMARNTPANLDLIPQIIALSHSK